jgi:hypothetical protein
LPQGLPKKIQFQLLLPDLALKLGNPLPRRLIIRHRQRRCRRCLASHGRSARPPSAPQHTFPPELQPPLVQFKGSSPDRVGDFSEFGRDGGV